MFCGKLDNSKVNFMWVETNRHFEMQSEADYCMRVVQHFKYYINKVIFHKIVDILF